MTLSLVNLLGIFKTAFAKRLQFAHFLNVRFCRFFYRVFDRSRRIARVRSFERRAGGRSGGDGRGIFILND